MTEPVGAAGPELTAAVVIGAERARAGRSLAALLAQTAADRIEIVCVDLAPHAAPIPETASPAVRYIAAPECVYMETGMVRCLEAARAPVVAFIEDHSYAAPEWAEGVIRSFERHPDAVLVNYAFTHAGEDTYLNRAFLVCEYGPWMTPARTRLVAIPACNNIAYRRAALEPYRDDLEGWLAMAPSLHERMLRAGGAAWLAPDAIVAHEGWTSLWRGCWANGVMKRMFGGYRGAREGWSRPRRWAYGAGMAAAPALHLARLAWSLRDRPTLWGAFVAALPVSLVVYSWASFQEALGYVAGPGNSRERFTAMELAVPRRP